MIGRSARLWIFGTVALLVVASASAGERARYQSLLASAGDFRSGVAAQRRGDLESAAAAYRAAIEKDPAFVEAMVNLARVQLARGEPEAAERTLERAGGRRDYPGVEAARGLVALSRGDTRRALDQLTRAREAAPNDVEVLTNLGAALLTAGVEQEAIDVLERASRLDPHLAITPLNLGLAHDRAGDARRARHHYRRFLKLSADADPSRKAVERRLAELSGESQPARPQDAVPAAPDRSEALQSMADANASATER